MTITTAGVYEVPINVYHGAEICDAPSISSTGLKAIAHCPLVYWHNSNLNPNREAKKETRAFSFGRAAHDLILDGNGWPDRYHVLPQGFSRAASVKQASAIAAADAAEAAGLTLLKSDDYDAVLRMAAVIREHPIYQTLGRGKAEQTLVWKDAETGVWLRCRPDFLPDNQRYIPDFKTCESAHPNDFRRDSATYGYHQQAALYLDGLEAVFGVAERTFFFIAQEKKAPFIVQPYAIDDDAVEWGRRINRKAIRMFAQCLETNKWPGYSDDFIQYGLPEWESARLLKDPTLNQGIATL